MYPESYRDRLPRCTRHPTNPLVMGKRLKGFEPSTFCMASRRSSQLSYSRADLDSSFVPEVLATLRWRLE
jgi:hypothetical protein